MDCYWCCVIILFEVFSCSNTPDSNGHLVIRLDDDELTVTFNVWIIKILDWFSNKNCTALNVCPGGELTLSSSSLVSWAPATATSYPSGFMEGRMWMRVVLTRVWMRSFPSRYSEHRYCDR